MALLIGTDTGLYRVEETPFEEEEAERVLDCGQVTSVRQFDCTPGVFVTAEKGAFRSTDGGHTWADLGVPGSDRYWYEGDSMAYSVLATAEGALYVGTNDPYLYRSIDDGETWHELRGFRELPSRGVWEDPRDPHYARVRALQTIPGHPQQLVVGVEAGGVHRSPDGGQTWTDMREQSPVDDIHQLVTLDEDTFLAATGHLDLNLEHLGLGHAVGCGGVHRTVDGGESWTRLDAGNEYSYVRRVFTHDGTLFFCGATEAPPAWNDAEHEAALFESTDFGRTFERVDHPGEPEVVEAWTVDDGEIYCGSGFYNVMGMEDYRGRIMHRDDDGEYVTVGRLPGNVSGLEAV